MGLNQPESTMNINQIHEEIVEYEAMREDEEWGAYLDHCVWSDPPYPGRHHAICDECQTKSEVIP